MAKAKKKGPGFREIIAKSQLEGPAAEEIEEPKPKAPRPPRPRDVKPPAAVVVSNNGAGPGKASKAKGAGRRDNPRYTQFSSYIPKDLHTRVRMALIEDHKELSAIIEELLSGWLKSRKRR
jgi:hypothetical protein